MMGYNVLALLMKAMFATPTLSITAVCVYVYCTNIRRWSLMLGYKCFFIVIVSDIYQMHL